MTLEIAGNYTKEGKNEGKNEGNIFICLQSETNEKINTKTN